MNRKPINWDWVAANSHRLTARSVAQEHGYCRAYVYQAARKRGVKFGRRSKIRLCVTVQRGPKSLQIERAGRIYESDEQIAAVANADARALLSGCPSACSVCGGGAWGMELIKKNLRLWCLHCEESA